jgi:hypothetical protein
LLAAAKPAKAGWDEELMMARYHQLKLVAKGFNSSRVFIGQRLKRSARRLLDARMNLPRITMTAMEDINPYAAPRHDLPLNALADEPAGSVWRDGELLVMRKGAVLPDRCVKCNAPAEGGRLRYVQLWHDPIYFLLLPLAPILMPFVVQRGEN